MTAIRALTNAELWVNTWRGMVCARIPVPDASLEYLLGSVYPELLRAGHDLPFNIMVDLACLYRHGPDMGFRPPGNNWLSAPLEDRYCRYLEAETAPGAFARGVWAVRHAARRRGQARVRRDCEDPSYPGIINFIEFVAEGLAGQASPPSLPADVADALEHGRARLVPNFRAPLAAAVEFTRAYLEAVLPPVGADQTAKLRALFAEEAAPLLSVASAQVGAAAQGTDLVLLQRCLDYHPPELATHQATRYTRLRRDLTPHQLRSARSPECGNHGITNRGSFGAVLRSFMARPGFLERTLLKQVLYFDRYAARQEPRRLFFGLVISCGVGMQVRLAGRRRDSWARELGAALLEDVVRTVAGLPALTLRAGIVLHNGQAGDAYRDCVLVLPPETLRDAPTLTAGDSRNADAWLPGVDGVLPHYFLREPSWAPPAIWRTGTRREARFDTAANRLAVQSLVRHVGDGEWSPGEDGACQFDLCHLTLMDAASETPNPEAEQGIVCRYLRSTAARPSVSFYVYSTAGLRRLTYPPLTGGSDAGVGGSSGGFACSAQEAARARAWDDWTGRLDEI